ncbi:MULTISPECIES: TldD/PmbA family protein [Pyrobaculum]|uniref:TldD/PmbA family protein n=1 Tax=Pyrobaculum arsenaticum TaxID=121277 RepID=A0A7L4P9D9_9CREN|nr:TldD/PmbA family protein [Pyrobaculum arsenaticum]MCY0890562.1 TldD/PmbA family protein [Pyrobaculum arsenaticum]NYR14496.1 TldD/PmbA family protein [Pyrobaculum arsenaticum]
MIFRILTGLVDEAAVVKTKAEHYMARFANDEITVFKHWSEEATYLYLAKGKRATFVGMTGPPTLDKIEEAAKRLVTVPEDPLYVPLGGPQPVNYSEPAEGFEKIPDLVKTAIDAAEGVERSAGVVHMIYIVVEYRDTAGRSGSYSANRVYLAMRSFIGDLSATSTSAGRKLADIKAEEVGKRNAQILHAAKGLPQVKIEPRRADVLLSPLVFGHLIGEVASSWASGSEILTGSSRYTKDDLGKEVASPILTVLDITSDKAAHGFTPFDLEGVPTRPIEIYRKGIFAGVLHTRRTAHALGMEPTGHALRNWAMPSPGHIYIAPADGPEDAEELFRELKNGYYIHNNWYTRFQNVKTGQFSTVGRDVVLEIKDGKPVAVVKFVRIADTLENVVKNIAVLSKETSQVYWWDMPTPVHAPYAVLKNIGITT